MKTPFIDHNLSTQTVGVYPQLPGPGLGWPFAEPVNGTEPESKIDWLVYWCSIKKRRWPILAAALVMAVAAAIYVQSMERFYRSTTTLLIESGKTKILSIEEVYNSASQDREYFQTQVEILRSRDVALRTVIATQLWDELEFDPRKPHLSWQEQIKNLFSASPEPLAWTSERLAQATVGKYLAAVTIEPVRLSQLVKISFDATDRDLAAKMADATAMSFIEADRNSRLKLNLSVTGQLQDRLSAVRDKLLQSEKELQAYRERTGLINMSGSQGVAGQQLSEIGQSLVAARVRRTELESIYQQADKALQGGFSSAPALISQPGIMEARSRVSLASLRLEELTRTLGDQHSRVIEARTALAAAQTELQLQAKAVIASLKGQAQAARDTERSLQGALNSAQTTVQGVNRQEFQLGVLEREVQTNKQLYEMILSRTKETSVSTNLQADVARIVDPATPAPGPLRPNKPQIILVTLLLVLSAGAVVSILVDKFKNTLQGSEEAESRLHQPVLATLPEIPISSAYGLTRSFLDHPNSHHAKGIRTARTSMLLSRLDLGHQLILVASALPGEGKTTLCTNLAFAHAQTKRTLLIECDLRNPQIGQRLGIMEDAPGLTNLVQGKAGLKECVHNISGSPLLVMTAGDMTPNPEEFLMSREFRETLRSLAKRVDMILIDSPPMTECSDALIISQQVHDTIYVVKARATPHPAAQRGLDQLRRAGASILGLVLTNMDTSSGWTLRPSQDVPDYENSSESPEFSV